MIRKSLVFLLVFYIGQTSLFALENKESLTKDAQVDKKPKKGFAIGIEGGYSSNAYQDYVSYNNNSAYGTVTTGNGKLGINMAGASLKSGGLSKFSYELGLGYIFVSDKDISEGYGLYFNTGFHRNFKLGKKGNNYFYTGYGIGTDLLYYDIERFDMDIQFARIPLGFKFLIQQSVELFFEYNFSLGMRWSTEIVTGYTNYYLATSAHFSINNEVKGGVRWWF